MATIHAATKEKWIGKKVTLFTPHSFTASDAIIKDVDELGWTFEEIHEPTLITPESKTRLITTFYSHSMPIRFSLKDES